MSDLIYGFMPSLVALYLNFIFYYTANMYCLDTWITPPYFFCIIIFIGVYVVFGILLYEAKKINNTEIFVYIWILVFSNIFWLVTFKKKKKYSLILLFISLLVGYFAYNAIFLSDLTNDDNTLYINLFSFYIIWIGLMITILIETSTPAQILKKDKNKLFDFLESK